MSAPVVENPIADPVSISCTCCTFQDFGRFPKLEPCAVAHSKDMGHPVRLSLGFLPVGVWAPDGTFRTMKGVDLAGLNL